VGVIRAEAQGRLGQVDDALYDPALPPDYYVANPGGDVLVLRAKEKIVPRYTVKGLSVVFRGLPKGTVVETDAGSMVADGGEDTVEFEAPATSLVELIGPAPKYSSASVEVQVG
jgi:hypothetical protein